MTANEYQREAMRTLNPALGQQDILVNGVMGLCGEAGEAINIVKKHLAQGHPLDREALIPGRDRYCAGFGLGCRAQPKSCKAARALP